MYKIQTLESHFRSKELAVNGRIIDDWRPLVVITGQIAPSLQAEIQIIKLMYIHCIFKMALSSCIIFFQYFQK